MNNQLTLPQIEGTHATRTYVFQMHVQCIDTFGELLATEPEQVEGMTESLVSLLLLSYFETVFVESFSITLSSPASQKPASYAMHTYIRCVEGETSEETETEAQPADKVYLIENAISCALMELFETVSIENIEVSPAPASYAMV